MDNCIHIQLMKFDEENRNEDFFEKWNRDPYWYHVDYFNIFIREDTVTNTKVFYGIDNDGLTYQFTDDEDTLRVIDELIDEGYTQSFPDEWTDCDYRSWRWRQNFDGLHTLLSDEYRTVTHPKYMESLSKSPVGFYHVPYEPMFCPFHLRGEWVMTRVSPLYQRNSKCYVLKNDDVPSLIKQGVYRGSKSSVPYKLFNRKLNVSMMSYLRKRLHELGVRMDKSEHTREFTQRECEDILSRKDWYRSDTFKYLSPVR